MEALVCFHGAVPAIAQKVQGCFVVGGFLKEGEEVCAAGAEEAKVGTCVWEGEEEGCCVEAVVTAAVGSGSVGLGLRLRLVGSTGVREAG